jgi:hypothetical protein
MHLLPTTLLTTFTILTLFSPTSATYCWNNTAIHWNDSYKACFGNAMGVWIRGLWSAVATVGRGWNGQEWRAR